MGSANFLAIAPICGCNELTMFFVSCLCLVRQTLPWIVLDDLCFGCGVNYKALYMMAGRATNATPTTELEVSKFAQVCPLPYPHP